jgi:hypothetical protein
MSDVSVAQLPREIKPQLKAYAFERSLGIPPAEACRRAGGKVENGHATKWEQNKRVQAWIGYYRSLGQDDEMIAAKRARIEERLALAAFGNIFDFAEIHGGNEIDIDWRAVAASAYAPIISGFKFDKDTGRLVDFERDSALQALAQLRDMHGFKAPSTANVNVNKTDATDWTTSELVAFVIEARNRAERDRAEGGGAG